MSEPSARLAALTLDAERAEGDDLRVSSSCSRVERASVSSVTDPERAWKVHVADSLTGLEFAAACARRRRIADIGSGAGFPGLVLAVALPDAQVDLIESVGRKCDFIQRAIDAAGIANARVINARSEELAEGEGREAYAAVTARAVGRLSTLAELASPLLAEAASWSPGRASATPRRRPQLASAAAELAMQPEQILHVGPYAGSEHRHLHLLRKSGPTPREPAAPRRAWRRSARCG